MLVVLRKRTTSTSGELVMAVAGSTIFVFGSNLAGRHGRGSALTAFLEHGAVYGQGEGLQGNAYGIPTKSAKLKPLPLAVIGENIARFIAFAVAHPELHFRVTAVGCGLAGYNEPEIAPFFAAAKGVSNIKLPGVFEILLLRSGQDG